jgi:hypothetical protein
MTPIEKINRTFITQVEDTMAVFKDLESTDRLHREADKLEGFIAQRRELVEALMLLQHCKIL